MAVNKQDPMYGLCYVMSEAFMHLHPQFELRPYRLRYYGVTHWWLQTPEGRVVDLTASQYTRPFPYHRGQCGGFLTKAPSKRARAIMWALVL